MPYEYSFRNAPPNLKPAFKGYANSTLTNCRCKLQTCLDNIDIDGALFHIGLLTRYLELKYTITRKIRAQLCRLCLKLLFEFPTDLMQQITIMKLASKLIRNANLSTAGLTLEWKPFYILLKSTHYSCNNGSTQMDQKGVLSSHQSHGSKLKGLIRKASNYFTDSFAQILDELLPYFNPNDIYYNRSVELLQLFLPFKPLWVAQEIYKYKLSIPINQELKNAKSPKIPDLFVFLLDQILNETLWVSQSPEKLLQILINIITHNREFKVFLEPFLTELFHNLYLNSELPINGRQCILKKADRLGKGSLSGKSGHFSLAIMGGVGISNIVELLVLLMDNRGDSDPIIVLFIDFFQNTLNYFYPDENRRTSAVSIKLTSILASFAVNYATRFWRELRAYDKEGCDGIYAHIPKVLRDDIYSWHAYFDKTHPFYRELDSQYKLGLSPKLFKTLLPIIKWSIYAKSPYIQYGGYAAIKALSAVFPQMTVEWAMTEVRECVESVTQSHRLSIGVGLLDSVTPTLINRYLLPNTQSEFVSFLKLILFGFAVFIF